MADRVQRGRGLPILQEAAGPPARLMTPLQAEMLEDGRLPAQDEIGATLERAGFAPDAGYHEAGPDPLPSPPGQPDDGQYRGWPPVFQWEIDPADPSLETREASVSRGDWEYEVWFQEHPAGLVYVSIQAIATDAAAEPARQHPIGRNVVVNLVYDRIRGGVAAVYGTAADFRHFVEAFRIAYGLPEQPDAGAGDPT